MGAVHAFESPDELRVLSSPPVPFDDCSGVEWVHVSLSRSDRVPNYDDLVLVKQLFIGPDRAAIMKLPRRSEHVNIHPHCLHLWCAWWGNDPTPDFTLGMGTL